MKFGSGELFYVTWRSVESGARTEPLGETVLGDSGSPDSDFRAGDSTKEGGETGVRVTTRIVPGVVGVAPPDFFI